MAGNTGPFDLSKMAFGGLGQMFDGIDSVKRAWSMFNAPSALVPTLDVDELDKRIADLKAVEQWLNLNVSMLHGTIQGLEIQRGTLAAVKAFGATFTAAAPGMSTPWSAEPAPAQTSAAQTEDRSRARAEPRSTASARTRASDTPSDTQPAAEGTLPGLSGIDAGAWWNLLQGTFNQVAQAALSGAGLPGAAAAPARARAAAPRKSSRSGTTQTGAKRSSKAAAAPRSRTRG